MRDYNTYFKLAYNILLFYQLLYPITITYNHLLVNNTNDL